MVKKKNIRKSALLLIMIMLATGITACGTEEEPLPDLSAMGAVTAVSREEHIKTGMIFPEKNEYNILQALTITVGASFLDFFKII